MNRRWRAAGQWQAAAAAVVLAGLAGRAAAHKICVSAVVEGRTVSGEAYFSGGGPVRNTKVTVLGPGGVNLGETTTGADGAFTFVPAHRCDHKFIVESADGHLASCTLPADELPADLPPLDGHHAVRKASAPPATGTSQPASPSAASDDVERLVEQAVGRRLGALEREIDRYRKTVRLHDVLGGVGYIFGLVGVVFYLKARAARTRAAG